VPVRDVAESYTCHFEEVSRNRGRADLSRVDTLVAVSMRVTGHGRLEIERAIREGAAKMRAEEPRDWAEYARRAADHAFGVSGEKDFQRIAKARDRLLAIEGCPRRREPDLDMPPFPGLGRWR
jgi:hypothetical protein